MFFIGNRPLTPEEVRRRWKIRRIISYVLYPIIWALITFVLLWVIKL